MNDYIDLNSVIVFKKTMNDFWFVLSSKHACNSSSVVPVASCTKIRLIRDRVKLFCRQLTLINTGSSKL